MTTYLIRHGRTSYSSRYLVNGDPAVPLLLDEEGVRTCRAARSTLPTGIGSWVTSTFPRTRQTARLLGTDPSLELTTVPQLDELDYGLFEGRPFLEYANWLQRNGPWTALPEAPESQRDGIRRMLLGVQDALRLPGPRVLVAHGLLLSVLSWASTREPDAPMPLFFPEAPYLDPLVITDANTRKRTDTLLTELDSQQRSWPATPADAAKSGAERIPGLANVGAPSIPSEEQSPHA